MSEDRIEQFKADIAEMRLKTGRANRENLLLAIGAVLMVAGVIAALVVYQASLNENDVRDVQSDVVLAVAMVGLSIVGAAVFLRYSIARFLRVWLLRQLYEGQAHIDRVVEAVKERG